MILSKPVFDLWVWAELAYHPEEVEKLQNANPMAFKGDFGFSITDEDCSIISFQGTGTMLKSDTVGKIRDWVSNLNAFPSMPLLESCGMTIHAGFYEGWAMFKTNIDAFVSAVKGKPIFVTGHSRGGALAALCARHIAKNLGVPCSCVTYGAPAQGGKMYRNEYNLLPVDLTNVIHGYDIVPKFPPEAIGYRHAGKTYWLQEPLYHRLFKGIRDHLPQSYRQWLQKNLSLESPKH
jgi:triacylglycerol lipase